MFIMHNCAMFKIAGYRLQRAVSTKEKFLFRTRFINAVLTHQGAIAFADIQQEIYSVYSFVFLASGVSWIIMTIYSFSQAIRVTKNIWDILVAVYSLIFQFSYLYFGNFISQQLIDHSSEMFTVTYDTQWYSMPVPAQKLIILILRRSMKSCMVTLAKMFQPSFLGFTTVCNMSMSYLMFLYSMQRSEF
nr:odorant receptor 22c-like [Megalopta genalis]